MFDLREHTKWTPKKGDVCTIYGAYQSLRIGILWKYTGKTVQYFRRNAWSRLYESLKYRNVSRPKVSWIRAESRMHWGSGTKTQWPKKIAPFAIYNLSEEIQKQVHKIQGEMPPRQKRKELFS